MGKNKRPRKPSKTRREKRNVLKKLFARPVLKLKLPTSLSHCCAHCGWKKARQKNRATLPLLKGKLCHHEKLIKRLKYKSNRQD